MSHFLLAGFTAILVIFVMVVWLIIQYIKLKREFMSLAEHVSNHNRDIAGLCSAAVTVDTRLAETDDLLQRLAEKVTEYERQEEAAQPYHSVIQQVRNGADVAELVKNFGLSRDEAVLLIRLHSGK